MRTFQLIALTPAGLIDPSIAIAASRAGELGVLNLEHTQDDTAARDAIVRMTHYARQACGIKLDSSAPTFVDRVTCDLPEQVEVVILTAWDPEALCQQVPDLRQGQLTVLLEVTCLEQAQLGEQLGVDGLIAKGHEAGGWVGEETTFILLQQLLSQVDLPIWAQGGIGLHTAAACYVAGAAGVVLDSQLALTREFQLPAVAKEAIAAMDGSETVCLGKELGQPCRVYTRPGLPAVEKLREMAITLAQDSRPRIEVVQEWRQAVEAQVGWGSPQKQVWPLGQDAAFAARLAQHYHTVGGVLGAIRESVSTHIHATRALRSLYEDAPLARSHGTRYPIVQGPMTRVSDRAEFALQVAEGGALPFLALGLLRAPEVSSLLEETQQFLGERPWGVGILGFVPLDLRKEQMEVIRQYRPPFALIAGGRPDQAQALEKDGIPTYLHVPSPGLLRLFLQDGARRFVFEGRECGGHVGPRSSFVLWNTMVDVLLEELPAGEASDCHVLFAGGIHDDISASMVAAMAVPLAERGVRLGVLLGTSYLFTQEAVTSGAILPGFQEEALRCQHTVLLETGPGHAIRCVPTPYVALFEQEKQRLLSDDRALDEIRQVLEDMNIGRLRIASKGITRHPRYGQNPEVPKFIAVGGEEQHSQGMYMIGQLAALRDRVCTIEELHRDVSVAGSERLAALSESAFGVAATTREERPCDVAIVGMACLLPKASDLKTYWENMLNKVDAIIEVPKDRWDWERYYDPDRQARDKVYSRWGGFLEEIPFDPTRYGIPPNALRSIEPIQLLTLEVVRAALEDAGYLDRSFPRERTSIILGAGGGMGDLGQYYGVRASLPELLGDVPPELLSQLPEWTEDSFPGILLNVLAGRVANRFDLGGVNYIVDAACASSLAAVYLAARELELGTSDMVIAGGVDNVQSPFTFTAFSRTQTLSPRGQCRTFDDATDGIVISEGIAIVVLKRLANAERDGDHIYAIIKGIAGSSDGRDKSLTAPRPEGQVRALNRAYAKAGISPATVGLIEAHGTGTVVGDQAEVETLKRVFGPAGATRQSCAIGSVKSMIGHTKCAAGVAGLIKVALALYYNVLPPTLGVEKPNTKARFEESPFYVNTETRPWINGTTDHPRRAGASAFGFGGTNFHAVLEEYTGDFLAPQVALQRWPSELFLWSAPSRQALVADLEFLEQALEQGAQPELTDLAYTLYETFNARRSMLDVHLAVVATSLDDLRQKLAQAREAMGAPGLVEIADPRGIYFTEQPLAREGKVAFLFPGQGSQYPNMLCDLALAFPEVREAFERADRALMDRLPKPLSGYVFPPPAFSPEEERAQQEALTQTNVTQPALGAADMALFRLLQELGVHPDMLAGHSYGEYPALCAAGAMDEETLLALSEARGRCIIEAAKDGLGTMAATRADAKTIAPIVEPVESVWIANLNAPSQTIISGTNSGVAEAVKRLEANEISARPIPVACAFHSPLVTPAQQRLAKELSRITFATPTTQVFSNTTAAPYPSEPQAIGALLAEHLVHPVRFVDEIEALYTAGARLFVEVGPRNVMTGLTRQILGQRHHVVVTVDMPGRPGLTQLQHALGQLAAHGVPVQLDRLFQGREVRYLDLSRLLEETAEEPLSPTTWFVNGGRARPLHEPAGPPHRPVKLTPAQEQESTGVQESRRQFPALTPASPHPRTLAQDGAGQVMVQFQRLMDRFLETQRNVMLAYLGSQGVERSDSEVVGHRDEAATRPPDQAEVAAPEPVGKELIGADGNLDREALTAHLLNIVSERTGYPTDMLDLDLDLEANLGIDSIKRVEILGQLVRSLASEGWENQNLDMEALSKLKTLHEIVDHIAKGNGQASASPAVTGDHQPSAMIQRFTLRAVDQPLSTPPGSLAPGRAVLITDDETGVAQEVAAQLQGEGYPVVVLQAKAWGSEGGSAASSRRVDLQSPEAVERALAEVRATHGLVAALIHLLPLCPERCPELVEGMPFERMDLQAWQKRLARDTRSLFLLAKALQQDFEAAAEAGGGVLIAASGMGGVFASCPSPDSASFFPGQGAIAGLLKTLAKEWAAVRVKAVDLDPQEGSTALAGHLLAELKADDDQAEIGYRDGRRTVLEPVLSPLVDKADLAIGADWVLLVTGGARGITADVALELAERYQPTLVLVGRTPLPAPEEAPDTAGLTAPRDLKAALIERLCSQGQPVAPAQVEVAYQRLLKEREIRRNMAALKQAGARVHYHSVDVRDEQAFGALINEIYQSFGRLDGVIHGAGIIEDKLVQDKTVDSFDRVLSTKAESAFILSRRLRPESLRFLIFFSSVAGRFGNRGQADYTAANEVLNKLAVYLDRRWPARVVSINWGPWEKRGMVSPELRRQFEERGIQLIPPATGRRMFDRELRYGRKNDAEVVIAGGIWDGIRLTNADDLSNGEAIARTRPPLLQNLSVSTRVRGSAVEVVRTLDPSHDLYLQDHQLDGKPVLPVAMATELMAEVAQQSWPDLEVVGLRDLQVVRGVVLERVPKTVRLIARAQDAPPHECLGINVDVDICDAEESDRLYYRAIVELADELPEPPPYRLPSLDDFQPFSMTVDEAYRLSLFQGPVFQGLMEIQGISERGMLATCMPSSPRRCLTGDPSGQWLIDPVVFDSGLQLIYLWTRAYTNMTPLPSRFRRYQRFGSLAEPVIRCHVQANTVSYDRIVQATLFFVGPDDRLRGLLVDWESISSKALNRLASSHPRTEGV
jgi:acyl transferase domain-containing protein/NAD(P)H-dependent flavin oxidoreductase YrpB (nitropropane dioxygenase family)